VAALVETEIGAHPLATARAVASQLTVTLPAALLMAAAAVVNLGAGAVVMRAIAGAPFAGLRQLALAGLAGAVLLDLVLMSVLAGAAAFRGPILLAVNVAVIFSGWSLRPWLASPPRTALAKLWHNSARWPIAAAIVLLVWSGPVTLQLASPVVPFLDVLPNQVAPVEHLRTFGSLASIDTTPSPIYGQSRIFLGYQALLGTMTTMVDLPAALAVAAFALPLLLLVACAGHALAGAIGGRQAAGWALLILPLSVTFLRLADARAGVLAFPLVALALWLLLDPLGRGVRRRAAVIAAALTAAMLIHPLIGLFGVATIGLAALARPAEHAGHGIPAALAAPVLAAAQLAVMFGLDAPAWVALLALPLGAIIFWLLSAVPWRLVSLAAALRVPVLGLLLGGTALVAVHAAPRLGGRDWLAEYPVLLAGTLLAIVVARRKRGAEVLAAGVLAAVLAGAIAAAMPGGSLTLDAIRFEVPKTVAYYAPTLLAIALAVALGVLWRSNRPLLIRAGLSGALVLAAAAPIRDGVVEDLSLGEHRLAESLAISWRGAARGYWHAFPDSRMLIDRQQAELIAALRAEIAASRLQATDGVLHVARSFQPWASTPLAVFAGVMETTATTDPEHSIHTEGGRLRDVAELPALLHAGYTYVVLEPAGLPGDVRDEIVMAGYRSIFVNARGEVFRRP
jgi:hypothetical protein